MNCRRGISGSAHQLCENNELSDLFDLCFLDNDLVFLELTERALGTNNP